MARHCSAHLPLAVGLAVSLLSFSVSAQCSSPGKSAKGLRSCGANKVKLKIKNMSRIVIDVFYVKTNGSLKKISAVPPGIALRQNSCKGHKWVIKNRCNKCISVTKVSRNGGQQLVTFSGGSAESSCPRHPGKWGPKVNWPRGVIPVALANLPGGKMLGFSSKSPNDSEGAGKKGDAYTFAGILDPKTGVVTSKDLVGHNAFCPGMTFLPDGNLVVLGGGVGADGYRVSVFNARSNSWSRQKDMRFKHWYGTGINTGSAVMIALGVKAPGIPLVDTFFPERSSGFNFGSNWKLLNNVNLNGKGPNVMNWYPHMHLMDNGKLLMSGPQNDMYVIDSSGRGGITGVGKRNKGGNDRDAWGAFTIYHKRNRVVSVGGIDGWKIPGDISTMFNRKHVIEINFNNPNSIKTTRKADITFERAFHNLVNMPTGDVLAVGGTRCKKQFCDSQSELRPEWWNPTTNKWTVGKAMNVPRNYHSSALLTQQGTVVSAGGGLCGNDCSVNHPDHQVYEPWYLFNQNGSKAPRPKIQSAPNKIQHGSTIKVKVSGANANRIYLWAMVSHASVTHSISTDSRMLKVKAMGKKKKLSNGVFEYTLKIEPNKNVLSKGRWFLFCMNSEGVPSVGTDVIV